MLNQMNSRVRLESSIVALAISIAWAVLVCRIRLQPASVRHIATGRKESQADILQQFRRTTVKQTIPDVRRVTAETSARGQEQSVERYFFGAAIGN
jgi:hypothetical protein